MSEQSENIKYEGGCLCGRTRFTIFADPTFASYCHCDDCRQSSGAAVSAYIGFDAANLVWQGEKLKGYKSSAKVTRTFCPECGTSISYEDENLPGKIYIFVGVMDDPDHFPMTSHSYIGEKLQWLHINDDLPTVDDTAAPRESDK